MIFAASYFAVSEILLKICCFLISGLYFASILPVGSADDGVI